MSESDSSNEQRIVRQTSRKGSSYGVKMVNVMSVANIGEIDSISNKGSDNLLVDENELNAMRVFQQQSESSRSLSQNDSSDEDEIRQDGQGHQESKTPNTDQIIDQLSWQGETIKTDNKKGKEKINSEVISINGSQALPKSGQKLPSDDEIQRRPSCFGNEVDQKMPAAQEAADKQKFKDGFIAKISSMISGCSDHEEDQKQDVYKEMKNNQIDRKQLINMLRNEDNPYSDEVDRKRWSDQIDDMKSQYTLQSINSCSDFDFLILLLQNFGRGKNSEIVELALAKVQEKFSNYEKQVKELRHHNEKILKENSAQKRKIQVLKSNLKKGEFDNDRLKKALHTRVQKYNSEVVVNSSQGNESNVIMKNNNISQKELKDRKRSIENYKRINTMGCFEIQKASLEFEMEKTEPKQKKKKPKNIPLPNSQLKDKESDVQKMKSFHTKTLGKVRENSPTVEFINENFVRSSRDIQPIFSQEQLDSEKTDPNRIGPKPASINEISSKRNHCYRPLFGSMSRIQDSKYKNSYFDGTGGGGLDSTFSQNDDLIPINFELTKMPQRDAEDEYENTFFK